ncbi:MAG: hypothetical protein LBG61_04545 [Burkholderiales bacterium]|jgi:hypothetical protein|nr:hypothetical protein [Burkholderiales bacterium]
MSVSDKNKPFYNFWVRQRLRIKFAYAAAMTAFLIPDWRRGVLSAFPTKNRRGPPAIFWKPQTGKPELPKSRFSLLGIGCRFSLFAERFLIPPDLPNLRYDSTFSFGLSYEANVSRF